MIVSLARGNMREALPALASILLLLSGWHLAAEAMAGMFLLAGPVAVLEYFLGNPVLLLRASLTTLSSATIGFLLGNAIGIGLAAIAISLPRVERLVSGIALVFFCLPFVATGPILRVIYGPGPGPQIVLAALASYYTTYLCLLVGFRALPANWLDLVRSYGRGRRSELLAVRAPAAIPYLFSALQIAAPAAFLGAMVGEFTGAEQGLGVLSIRAMRGLDVDGTWAIALLAAAISSLAYFLFGWAGRQLMRAPTPVLLSPRTVGERSGPIGQVALGAGIVLSVLLVWLGLMEALGLNRFFAKRPLDIWFFLFSSPEAASNRYDLLAAFVETLSLTIPGYIAGLGLGAVLAIMVVLRPGLATGLLPVAIALRSIPIVTTAPLLVLALGRGAAGTITIVAVMIFFPTFAACLEGLRRTPRQVLDLMDSYRTGAWQRLIHAQVPAMMPAFFAAARMAIPAALLAATTAEWLATGRGMGSLMALTASTSNYLMLWSAIVLLVAAAGTAYAGVSMLERRVLEVFASEQLAV